MFSRWAAAAGQGPSSAGAPIVLPSWDSGGVVIRTVCTTMSAASPGIRQSTSAFLLAVLGR